MATTRPRSTETATPKRRAAKRAAAEPTAPKRTRKAAAMPASPVVTVDDIALRAFLIFEAEGGGDQVSHWLRAERELATA